MLYDFTVLKKMTAYIIEMYNKNGDDDGESFHEIKEPSIVQVIGRVEKDVGCHVRSFQT